MSATLNIRVSKNFEHNLESIRCFFHAQRHELAFEELVDKLFDTIIPNLQTHPHIGTNFLARPVNSLEELKKIEAIKKRLSDTATIRQYNDKNYAIIYYIDENELVLLTIKHQKQLTFEILEQAFE